MFVSVEPGDEKKSHAGGRKKIFFRIFSEDCHVQTKCAMYLYKIIYCYAFFFVTVPLVDKFSHQEVRQLKSVSKLHANTSSPGVYCQISFELAVPYGTNATGNLTPRGPDTMLNQSAESSSTTGKCAPMQAAIARSLESFNHREI